MSAPTSVLVIGRDDELEAALRSRGLQLVRDRHEAESLLTLPPPLELHAVAELEPEDWRRLFAAWAEEPFFAAQPWLRAATERGSGTWVAVTTLLAAQPFPGGVVGAAALALQTLVRVAATEGVRANVVAPGWTEGRLPDGLDGELAAADTPARRLASAADVAAAVAWLLSDESAHVSGEVLRVDGGYTLAPGSRPDPRKE
jgi:NAD(P)-dependent dehydrogenase (short-subunit alcohol dehydrogenase family)